MSPIPSLHNLWVPHGKSASSSAPGSLYFVELLVHNKFRLLAWLSSGYVTSELLP